LIYTGAELCGEFPSRHSTTFEQLFGGKSFCELYFLIYTSINFNYKKEMRDQKQGDKGGCDEGLCGSDELTAGNLVSELNVNKELIYWAFF